MSFVWLSCNVVYEEPEYNRGWTIHIFLRMNCTCINHQCVCLQLQHIKELQAFIVTGYEICCYSMNYLDSPLKIMDKLKSILCMLMPWPPVWLQLSPDNMFSCLCACRYKLLSCYWKDDECKWLFSDLKLNSSYQWLTHQHLETHGCAIST